MKRTRLLSLIGLFVCATVARADIKIVFTPATVAPGAAKTVQVDVHVRVPAPTAPGQERLEPHFQASLGPPGAGTLQPDFAASQNARTSSTGPTDFIIGRLPTSKHAEGRMRYTLRLNEPVKPGEISLTVRGHVQVTLLGLGQLGDKQQTGVGKLVVTQAPSAPPPPQKPPAAPPRAPAVPQPAQVDTSLDPRMIAALAIVLGLLGLLGMAGLRSLLRAATPAAAPRPSRPAAPKPAAPKAAPPPSPSVNMNDLPAVAPDPRALAAAAIVKPPAPPRLIMGDVPRGAPIPLNLLRPDLIMGNPVIADLPPPPPGWEERFPPKPPTPFAGVELTTNPTEVIADGSTPVALTVSLAAGTPPGTVILTTGFRCLDYPQRIVNEGAPGAVIAQIYHDVDWAWQTHALRFQADVKLLIPGYPPNWYKTGIAAVTVRGADPVVHVISSQPEIDGVGRDTTELTATLELFGAPAGPLEILEIQSATAEIGGHSWNRIGALPPPEAGGARASWTAPFLLARPNQPWVDAPIHIVVRWLGGPLFERARRKPRREPLTGMTPVRIHGCIVVHKPAPSTFLPIEGTPLQVEARLARSGDRPMLNPFASDSLHAPRAGVECRVEDRTQAKRPDPPPHGCTIPPLPADSGPKWTLRPGILESAKLWTPRNLDPSGKPPADTTGLDILLGAYTPRGGHDPVDAAPLNYELVANDGMGDPVTASGAIRVKLLVVGFDTGVDFHAYEYSPWTFEASVREDDLQSPLYDEIWRLDWEFAVVDDTGKLIASAGRFSTFPNSVRPLTRMPLTIGQWRERQPVTRPDGTTTNDDDRLVSQVACRRWHDAAVLHGKDQEAVTPARTQRPDGSFAPSPWTDRVVFLAARLELRTNGNHLLGTSDLFAGPVRVPPQMVWQDPSHRFRFVLAKVRSQMRDIRGRPFADRWYRITSQSPDLQSELPKLSNRVDTTSARIAAQSGAVERESRSTAAGLIEWAPAPGALAATLVFPPPQGRSPDEPWCEFDLDLGGLPDVDNDEGVRARLENLGLVPGDSNSSSQFARAVERFQTLAGLVVNGQPDAQTRARLEEADRMANLYPPAEKPTP